MVDLKSRELEDKALYQVFSDVRNLCQWHTYQKLVPKTRTKNWYQFSGTSFSYQMKLEANFSGLFFLYYCPPINLKAIKQQTTQLAIVWPIITRHFGHGFLHHVEHCSTLYQISVPEKNWYRFAWHTWWKPVQVFWYGFSVPVSGACVIGIRPYRL